MENKTILLTKNLPSASDTIQIVFGDNLAYRVHFVIERYWGDTDLNSLTWTINIRNASGEIYTASLTKYAHNNTHVTLSWNLTGAASAVVGGADYTVVGKTSAQDTPIWKSPEGHINVLDAIGTGGTYEGVDPDPIEQMLLEIREYVDDLVIVSETEPVSETNKIWFEPTPESEVVVPTNAEFEDLSENVVHFDKAQTLSDAEKTQAQANIGLDDIPSLVTGTVKYSEAQTLQPAEQQQARENIGLGDLTDYVAPIINGVFSISNNTLVISEVE